MNERQLKSQPYRDGNVFLDALPAAERDALYGGLIVVELEAPDSVFARGGPIEHVYFPIDSLFSVTAELRRYNTVDVYEVGVLGREGIVGAEVALGVPCSRRFVLTQIAGRAARLPAGVLAERAALEPGPARRAPRLRAAADLQRRATGRLRLRAQRDAARRRAGS